MTTNHNFEELVRKLKATLEEIVHNLQQGRYRNEQSISFMVVAPILSDLGWDTKNPDVVWPEYTLQNGRVDFALCFPAQHPKVFVEVKQPGRAEGADEQLFNYAVSHGVRMALLTDGRTWSFYLPGEEGSFEERRVYKLDLLERKTEESAESLIRYLACVRIESGAAIDDAVKELRDRGRVNLAVKTIPAGWQDLVESEDPTILERLTAEVETKCGVRPDADDVVTFLKTLGARVTTAARQPSTAQTPIPQAEVTSRSRCGYELQGSWQSCRTAKQVMVGLLQEFTRRDPSFPQRCTQHPDNQGRRRTCIAKTPAELYSGNQELEEYGYEFSPGWFVDTNVSNDQKEKIIKMACQVAGLKFGSDVKIAL